MVPFFQGTFGVHFWTGTSPRSCPCWGATLHAAWWILCLACESFHWNTGWKRRKFLVFGGDFFLISRVLIMYIPVGHIITFQICNILSVKNLNEAQGLSKICPYKSNTWESWEGGYLTGQWWGRELQTFIYLETVFPVFGPKTLPKEGQTQTPIKTRVIWVPSIYSVYKWSSVDWSY